MRKELHRFRPMGISNILDETVDIYKSNFVLLAGIAAMIYIPYLLLTLPLHNISASKDISVQAANVNFAKSMLALVLNIIPETLVTAVLTLAISERYLGRRADILSSFKNIFKQRAILPVLTVTAISYFVIAGPMMVLVGVIYAVALTAVQDVSGAIAVGVISLLGLPLSGVWAAYMWSRLAIVAPTVVLESTGGLKGLSRSWRLMQGNVLKAFAVLLIATFVMSILTMIVIGPTSGIIGMNSFNKVDTPSWLIALNSILTAIMTVLTTPVTAIVSIMLYYDMRIRKEGFDLEILAGELDAKSRQTTTPVPSEEHPADGESQ